MSLKIKTAARLKALFPGVALSKKSVEAIGDQFAKAGLTDESTDDEIDAKLNERNAIHSFEDQKKFEDYQVGKANREAADKEAARLKAEQESKTGAPEVKTDDDTPAWAKALIQSNQALQAEIANIKGEKVATTRREQYAKTLDGTSEAFKAEALKDFDRLSFKDDADYTEWLGAKTESVKGFIQDEANQTLGGDRPAGGGGGNDTSKKGQASQAEMDAAFKDFKL